MNSKLIQSMFKHKVWYGVLLALLVAGLVFGAVLAEDGPIFRRNISKTPDQETERANINHMSFYVPAQTSAGEIITIEYYDAENLNVVDTRDYAKPLVSVYIDGMPHEEEVMYAASGAGYGQHDAYAALSLDDGATWKRTNLSNSADLSSFNLATGEPYPGDAHNMTFAIAGDKVLVGWISKYCDGGSPMYTLVDEEVVPLQEATGLPDLYFRDIWGVAGSQRSVDYTAQGFPEVGEIPYSCVWSARGQLLEVDEEGVPTVGGGLYDIVWTKAERLTSGRRDANRLEMQGDTAAGFMMVWQEDPDGLRPGQGLGPGEGWSGAVVNQETDLWYSFISFDNFVQVQASDEDTAPVPLEEYTGETMPKAAIPMAMPIRLTDNKKCMTAKGEDNTETEQFPYCFVNFDDANPYGGTDLEAIYGEIDWDNDDAVGTAITRVDGQSTFCSTTISWTNPGGTTLQLCQAEDLRVLGGRVGSSRPRVNVQPYNSLFIVDDVDDTTEYDSAIVIIGSEESKALGEGGTSDIDQDDVIEPEDIGKNMWYYTFDLLNPAFVQQGGMLNQPAKCNPHDAENAERCANGVGEFYTMLVDDFGNEFYETEISRRFSHMSQPIHQFGETGVSAALIVKQGIINQGGPADIFLRLTKVGDDVVWEPCELDGDPATTEQCLPEGYNPYAFENLVCDEWAFTDGTNPRYLQGVCLDDMLNVSGGTIVSCDIVSSEDCAEAFPWDGGETYPKVTEWVQLEENLDDQSWENPYDVAKGHRGYIDGDFIMMMYAWAPNWKANTVGNDHYNLYARRSFDGGLTWTTTPADLGGVGTTTCENYGAGSEFTTLCTDYGAGEFEQARNLSQLTGNKVTILDPRYTPTGGLKMLPVKDKFGLSGDLPYVEDAVRDPSKFFIVYETGDNTTVAEGEAVPLDLFYSRAFNWGDDYDLIEYYNSTDGEVTLAFDWLEHDQYDLSGEAANTANNAGTSYYVVWNQWQEDEHENISDSDIIFRRLMYTADDADATPTATILYVSHYLFCETYETLTFIGTAKDNDHLGDDITAYKWRSSIDGDLSDQKQFSMPGWALTPGWHTISFSARDGEGHWSREVSINLLVAETISKVNLPLVIGP